MPAEISRAPLLRFVLLRRGAHSHVAVCVMHHIVSDAWSIGVFVRELGMLYRAFAAGQPSPLPALPVQMTDFARWEQEHLLGDVLERQLGYWRRRLAGSPAALELPADHPRDAVVDFRGARQAVSLTAEVTSRLHRLSQETGATLFMTLLAAYGLLLGRWAGQSDVIIGVPVAGRRRPELEGLIGYFLNSLALRLDLRPQLSFRQLVAQVKDAVLAAYDHQDVPFDKLVEELRPRRLPGRSPYFQVVFNFLNVPAEELQLPELHLQAVAGGGGEEAKYELTLYLQEAGGQLVGTLAYNDRLFLPSTISRQVRRFERLLEHLAARPEVALEEVELELAAAPAGEAWEEQRAQKLGRLRKVRERKAVPAGSTGGDE